MPLTEAAKAKKKKRDDEAHQQAAKSIVNKTVKAADHANKAVSNNTRQPSVSQKTQSTVERLNQKYGRNQSQPPVSTVKKPSQTSPKTQKTVDRLNEKYGKGKVTGGKHSYMDDVVDTAKSTLRQVAAEEARAFNASARTLTSKDSYLYASQAEIDAANKRAEERDKKFRAKIKHESAEMEKLKQGHSYLGQQGLSAVSSAVGMATDAAWGPAALAHMFTRTQAGSEGNVKEKVEPLKQKLSASGNYSQEEIDEMFKDVDKWDLANSVFEGGIEVLSEKMFGGFGLAKKVGGSGILDKSLARLGARMGSKATTGVLGRVARGTAEEVAEEEVGNPLQTLASNLIYGNRMQNINEDATRRELQAQSDAIRSRIQTPEDAQAVATQLGSKEFMADSRAMYLESGMSEKEADELASMTRDYLEAAALGDTDKMRDLQDKMVKKLAGGENSLKEKWTLQDAIDAAVSTSLMTVTTGAPGAVTNSMMGKSYKDTNGMDAVKNLAKVTKNLDPEKSVRAQAIMDRIDAGEDISGTQVYDLIQWSSEAATESYKREDVKERMADSVMKRENLFVAPSVRNEDGSVTLGEETERRYDKILEENKAKAKTVQGISREDAEIAADVATAFQLGTITANQMNELSSDNLEVREAFHQITGINLNQFDTSANPAENNIAMQESLFARAADNYIESARIEQEAWNDGARGEVESSITEGLGSNGDVAVHDALNAVDPRDRSTFILMGRASASVYDYARFSEDSWEDVSKRLRSMYPSLPQDALKGVYESAKKDKKIAETPYYNAKVKANESSRKLDMSEAEQTEFGKFTNEAQRQLKDSEQIVLQSLAQQFNINIKLLPSKAFKTKSEGKNGKTKLSYTNGAYNPKTRTMFLNGGNDMERNLIAVALHEITHHIATYAPDEYIKLSNRVMDRWYKNDSEAFKEAIQQKQAEYKKAVKQDLSEEQALEEIIADAVGEMNSDRNFIEQICREEPTLAEKIINAIKDVLHKLRQILSSGRISEEYEDAFFAQLDMWDEAQRLWLQAAKVAQKQRSDQMIDEWDAQARIETTEETTTRFSITEDSSGKELTEGQKEYFKDSKIVDAEGRLKVMYHGTPNMGFTVFDRRKTRPGTLGRGFYFSDQDSHAGQYGARYEVYLNITQPLATDTNDITKDQLRAFVEEIAEDEDYGLDNYGYGATVDSVVDDVWGKSDFRMMQDINLACVGDMAEAVKLFNSVNGTNYDGIVTDLETVAFYPEQIKNIDNENPTEDPDIRYSVTPEQDSEYMDAVERGDMEEAQRLVDEAARRAGYTVRVYHGTIQKPFTVFNKEQKNFGGEQIPGFIYGAKDREYAEIYTEGIDPKTYHYIRDGHIINGYMRINNPIDLGFVNADILDDNYDVRPEYDDTQGIDDYASSEMRDFAESLNMTPAELMHHVGEKVFNRSEYIWEFVNTPEFAELIDSLGYDGIILEEQDGDDYFDTYGVLDSSQFKSADPVTYDDNGNVITLSERFNEETPDIRYSVTTDKEDFIKGANLSKELREWANEIGLDKLSKQPVKGPVIVSVRDLRTAWYQKNGRAEEAEVINTALDKIGDSLTQLVGKYQYIDLGDALNAAVTYRTDAEGHPTSVILSCQVKNAEYEVNFDFTTICAKRLAMQKILERFIKTEGERQGTTLYDELKLDEEGLYKLRLILETAGFDVSCRGCFVEQNRYSQQNQARTIANDWNAALDEWAKKNNTEVTESFDLVNMDIDSLDYDEIQEAFNRYSDLMQGRDTSVETKNRTLIEAHPFFRKRMNPSDYASMAGQRALMAIGTKQVRTKDGKAKKGTTLYGLLKRGQSDSKQSVPFTAYNGEVALLPDNMKGKSLYDYLLSIGGARAQSASDFQIEFVYDYMQMVADLSARGLPMHMYTKVIELAELFGMTGIKINLSAMCDVADDLGGEYAGLKLVDGKYEYNISDQSIDYPKAVELQKKDGYSKNIGIIMVTLSSQHMLKSLDDPDVRYIIGYHSSAMPVVVANMSNMGGATDYTKINKTNKLNEKGKALFDEAMKEAKGKTALEKYKNALRIFDEKIQEETAKKKKKPRRGNEYGAYMSAYGNNTADFNTYDSLLETKDARKTADKYLEHCMKNDLIPIYFPFAFHENYYKCEVYDFNMYDNNTGEYAPMESVQNIYPGLNMAAGETDTTAFTNRVSEMMDEQNRVNQSLDSQYDAVFDEAKDTLKFSITGDDYMDFDASGIEHSELQHRVDMVKQAPTAEDLEEGNNAVFKGKAFWSGSASALDGYIEEVHTYAEAENWDFHHSLYFSPEQVEKIDNDENVFFWVWPDGSVETQWRNDEAPSNIVKAIEKQITTKADSVRYSISVDLDEPYMQAVNSGNMKEAQRLVDEAAKAAGYDIKVYHGTNDKPFNVFTGNPERMEENGPNLIKGYFSDQYNYSAQYGKNVGTFYINARDFLDVDGEYTIEDMEAQLARRGITDVHFNDQIDEANLYSWFYSWGGEYGEELIDPWMFFNETGGNLTEKIRDAGYKGVTWAEGNITDGDGAAFMPFDSSLVKSADPVTYREDGSVIPLSERFDPSNNDIRYSLPTQDSDGNILSDGQMEFFKNSQARDEQGRLVPVYHTSEQIGITIFNPINAQQHRGIFFTDSLEMSQSYYPDADNSTTYSAYLNLTDPLIVDGQGNNYNNVRYKEEHVRVRGTDDIADYASAVGYDGVIFKNITDYGSEVEERTPHDVYVAFSSNQVKGTRNTEPSENPDIRFSITDDDEAMSKAAESDAWDNSVEALAYYESMISEPEEADRYAKSLDEEKMNKFYAGLTAFADGMRFEDPVLEEGRVRLAKSKNDFMDRLNAEWNENWLTEGEVLDIKSVKAEVRQLVMSVMKNSDTDKQFKTDVVNKTLIDIRLAYQFAKKGRIDVADALIWHSALRMIENVEFVQDDTFKDYKDLRDYLRSTRISLGPEYWSDVNFGQFRKDNFGRLKLVKGDTNVDDVYMELSERWPEWFDPEEEMTPPDMLEQIAHALDVIKPYKEAYSSEAAAEIATDIAYDLSDIVYGKGKPYESIADKYKNRYEAKAKAMKQRHEEALRKVKEQRDKGIKAERAKWHVREEKRKERTLHKKYYDSITRSYNKLYERLTTNTKDKHIPEQYKRDLAELLSAFDLQTVASKKVEKRRGVPGKKTIKMSAIRTVLKNIASKNQLFYINDTITDIMEELLGDHADGSYSRSIEGISVDELNSEELKKIDKLLKSLIHEFNVYESVRVGAKRQQAADIGSAQIESSLSHAGKFGEGNDYQNFLGALDKVLNLDELTPAYLFRQIDPSGNGLGIMFRELRRSFDKYIRNQNQLNEWMNDILGQYHNNGKAWNKYGANSIEEWRSEKNAVEIHLANGTITVTPAQMMSIYCLQKRQQAYSHMTGAGVVIQPVSFQAKMTSDLLKKANYALPVILTDDDIKLIVSKLTKEQVDVADKLQNLMADKMAAWGNEASMAVLGIRLFEDPDYFPIKSDKAALEKDFSAEQFVEAIRNFGFTKAVQPGARNAIAVGDIFDVVAEHCNNMNLYNAYSEAMNDFMKVYNYHEYKEDGSDYSVEQAIAHAYSRKATTFIMTFMKDLNGNVSRERTTGIEAMMNDSLGKAKKASVFANGRVALQQPTALTRAFYVISPKYMNLKISKASLQEMFDHCPIALWKSWGYYDINMGKSIEDLMMNNGNWLDDKFSDIYGQLDNRTWAVIWNMCKAETEDLHPELKKGTEEYWEAVNARMTEVVDLTQVVDSPFHRSHAMRNKNTFVKMATAFMAEPTLTFNMVRDGLRRAHEAYKSGNKAEAGKIAGKTAKIFVASAFTTAAFAAVWDVIRAMGKGDDDEDKNVFDLWWTECMENLKDNINLLNNIYYVKDLVSLFQGWDQKNLGLQGWKHLADSYRQLTGSYKGYSSMSWWQNALAGVGYLTGIPLKTMMNDGKAIMNIFGIHPRVLDDIAEHLDSIQDMLSGQAAGAGVSKVSSSKGSPKKSDKKSDDKGSFVNLWTYDNAPFFVEDGSVADKFLNHFGVNLTAAEIKALEDEEHQREIEKKIADIQEKTADLSGEAKDKKVWSYVTTYLKAENEDKSLSDFIEKGDYRTVNEYRDMYLAAGGREEYFDSRIFASSKKALKLSIISDPTDAQIEQQNRIKDYLLTNGMTEAEMSEIAYKSTTARDLKAAFRLNDRDAMVEELIPLVRAGLTYQDLEKLYKYRNSGRTSYDGKYKDRFKSTGHYNWPITGQITSNFGHRSSPGGIGSTYHQGLDIAGSMGDPVGAADGGTVVYAGWYGGAGKTVMIEHDDGTVTQYSHLSWYDAKVGDVVGQGQAVGNVGSTGNSTGPHLHFAVKVNGKYVDPITYLND